MGTCDPLQAADSGQEAIKFNASPGAAPRGLRKGTRHEAVTSGDSQPKLGFLRP